MNSYRRLTPLGTLAFMLTLAFATTQCGSDTPTQPTTTPAVSGVALSPASTSVGTTVQGVVSLTVPAQATGATISLSSSNTAVAAVQTDVTAQAASSSASFNITAMSPGTAAITATFNGTSKSSTITVTAGTPSTFSISLSPVSVVGGNPVTGTVTLNSPAPSGGAVISLSGSDPVILPAPPTVAVAAGATTATFTLGTKVVNQATTSTMSGAYGGGTASATLSVTPLVTSTATARFGVTGTNVTDTCDMEADGASLRCTFDGSTSTAPGTIVSWDWTYTVATTISQTTTTPVMAMPSANCALLPAPPLPDGTTSFPLTVTLRIRDSLGNVSAVATNSGARILPQGACGF